MSRKEVNLVERTRKKSKEGWNPISLRPDDVDGYDARPNDTIVVELQIGHRDVRRILIDNGSSTDILSESVFQQLCFLTKDLEPFDAPLRAFGGSEIRPLGTVKLPVRVGQTPARRTN